jgi:sulfite exporter TauE/SafE
VTPAAAAVGSGATLWAVFAVGLAGGFGHCIAMCGPMTAASAIASSAAAGGVAPSHARGRGRPGAIALWQLAYHGGRLLTYACIGAILGAVGSVWAVRGVLGPLQRWMWLAVGVLMIVMGLAVVGVPVLARLGRAVEGGAGLATSGWYSRAFGWLTSRGPWAAIPLGMLNGLLPCGFLMSVEASALAVGSPVLGAATMLAFGLGTVPALAGFGAASGLIGAQARAWLLYIGGAVVVALGALYVVRALSVLGGG